MTEWRKQIKNDTLRLRGEVLDRLGKYLLAKHDEEISDLKVSFARQMLQMERGSFSQDQQIKRLIEDNTVQKNREESK